MTPVDPTDLLAAIHRAATGNPLLGIDTGDGTGRADRLDAAALVDAVGAWAGTDERRVAASLVVLGYSARLLGPTLALLLRDGILLDARPERVRYAYVPARGFRLCLPGPAGWRGEPEALLSRWCTEIVDGHLAPVLDAVRAVVPVAAGLLWGNVASGVAGTLATLAGQHAVPVDRCHAAGLAVLGYGPLRGTGRLALDHGRLTFTRRSCCLIYRIGGGTCGDCPLT